MAFLPYLKRARSSRGMRRGNWSSSREPSAEEWFEAENAIRRLNGIPPLVEGDSLDGFCGFCGVAGHRALNCTALDHLKENDMVEDPETYLSWDNDGVKLVCERQSCRVRDGSHSFVWEKRMPYKLLPETAVFERAQHVATHINQV